MFRLDRKWRRRTEVMWEIWMYVALYDVSRSLGTDPTSHVKQSTIITVKSQHILPLLSKLNRP